MNPSDLFHAVNAISASVYNLKFCTSASELHASRLAIHSFIYELRTDFSAHLYIFLVDGLDHAFSEQAAKFEGV